MIEAPIRRPPTATAPKVRRTTCFHSRLRAVPLSAPAALSFGLNAKEQWRVVNVADEMPGNYAVVAMWSPLNGAGAVGVVAELTETESGREASPAFAEFAAHVAGVYGDALGVVLGCDPSALRWIAMKDSGRIFPIVPGPQHADLAWDDTVPEHQAWSFMKANPELTSWVFSCLASLVRRTPQGVTEKPGQ